MIRAATIKINNNKETETERMQWCRADKYRIRFSTDSCNYTKLQVVCQLSCRFCVFDPRPFTKLGRSDVSGGGREVVEVIVMVVMTLISIPRYLNRSQRACIRYHFSYIAIFLYDVVCQTFLIFQCTVEGRKSRWGKLISKEKYGVYVIHRAHLFFLHLHFLLRLLCLPQVNLFNSILPFILYFSRQKGLIT